MPPLALLERPEWSRGRKRAMWPLRVYLVASVVLLFVKAVQLGWTGPYLAVSVRPGGTFGPWT